MQFSYFPQFKVLGFLVILSWIKFVEHELLIKMKNEKNHFENHIGFLGSEKNILENITYDYSS